MLDGILENVFEVLIIWKFEMNCYLWYLGIVMKSIYMFFLLIEDEFYFNGFSFLRILNKKGKDWKEF